MSISDSDKAILREVGKRVAEIAADPVQGENIELWKRLNRLERTRPLIMLYDWTQHETGLKFELTCEGDDARAVEQILRGRVYHWQHQRDDWVCEPVIYCQIAMECGDYGIQRDVEHSAHVFGADAYIPSWPMTPTRP